MNEQNLKIDWESLMAEMDVSFGRFQRELAAKFLPVFNAALSLQKDLNDVKKELEEIKKTVEEK